jgi:hypothetical protein
METSPIATFFTEMSEYFDSDYISSALVPGSKQKQKQPDSHTNNATQQVLNAVKTIKVEIDDIVTRMQEIPNIKRDMQEIKRTIGNLEQSNDPSIKHDIDDLKRAIQPNIKREIQDIRRVIGNLEQSNDPSIKRDIDDLKRAIQPNIKREMQDIRRAIDNLEQSNDPSIKRDIDDLKRATQPNIKREMQEMRRAINNLEQSNDPSIKRDIDDLKRDIGDFKQSNRTVNTRFDEFDESLQSINASKATTDHTINDAFKYVDEFDDYYNKVFSPKVQLFGIGSNKTKSPRDIRNRPRPDRDEANAKKQAEEDVKARAKEDADAKKQSNEYAKARAKEEAKRKQEYEDDLKFRAKDEAKRKKQAEEDAKAWAKDEAKRKKQDEEDAKAWAKDEAKRKKQDEEDAKHKKQPNEDERAWSQADEDAKARARAKDEVNAKKKADEDRSATHNNKIISIIKEHYIANFNKLQGTRKLNKRMLMMIVHYDKIPMEIKDMMHDNPTVIAYTTAVFTRIKQSSLESMTLAEFQTLLESVKVGGRRRIKHK